MATVSEPADDLVVSPAEFARLRGVHRSRVTRYIKEGKISGPALVHDGRGVKVRVGPAMAQLRERLDIGQQIGNGIDARTTVPTSIGEAISNRQAGELFEDRQGTGHGAPDLVDSIEAQIKRERLRSVQIANRKAAEEEEERKGRFMETEAAKAKMASLVALALQSFEGGLADMATAVAERFEVPQRDVLHLLKGEFRKVCASAAERARKKLDATPSTIETVVQVEGEDAP